jgi:hypothetical protein
MNGNPDVRSILTVKKLLCNCTSNHARVASPEIVRLAERIVGPLIAYVGIGKSGPSVELGQLCVAAIELPILLNLRRNPSFVRLLGSGLFSLAVAFVGSCWMVERMMQR